MSDVVFYRFQPDAMERETLKRLFKGEKRKELLKKLTREIKAAVKNRTPRYYLIFGPRGVGKTHFVTLLYCDVEDQIDNALPLKLSEEEFSVYRVSDLLLRVLELSKGDEIDLSDFERMSDDEVVVAAIEELKSTGKMIVLFLENLNQILGEQMAKSEVQRLRSIFQTENIFTVVTTAPLMFPQVSEHEEPFFNFFEYIYLDELTKEELKDLIMEIATIENDEAFLSKMDGYTQKIDAVYVLTGGSPRMAMLLYDLMSKGNLVDVEIALFKILDENTPYYQDIFRSLSAEKRRVFDTLIELGKPATPKEIAEKARLDNKTVNTLLRRLETAGHVRSKKMGRSTKYEVREQLFRLWRELRRQPFAMQKLSIFMNFLELWYTVEERKEKFLELFEGLKTVLDEKGEREASYWFSSLPKDFKEDLIPRVVEELYEVGAVKLLGEFMVYEDRGLKEKALRTELEILLDTGEYKEFLKKAEEMIKDEEDNAFAWFAKGTALIILGEFNDALEAFSKTIELDPEDAFAWSLKGFALLSLMRNEEALEAFFESIELNPEYADAWYLKGLALGDLERYEEALEAVSRSLELNPENADAWYLKGLALRALERYEEALEAVSRSLELNPENADAWYLKGMALGDLERHEEALEAISRYLELNPEDVDAWSRKGWTLGNLGRYEEALEAISRSLELNPENADAWNIKGEALGVLGRYEEELEAVSRSLELNPDKANAWDLKGMALEVLGRHEEALEAISRSLELNPENAGVWYVKGIVYLNISIREFMRNNYGNALENLNSAVEALDRFSDLSKEKVKAKGVIIESLMKFLKVLVEAKNVKVVESALNALFEKKKEFEEFFEPIAIAVEIVKSKDVNKFYELQVERREVVADIVKKLTGSDELVPVT